MFSNLHVFSATDVKYQKDALTALNCSFHGTTEMSHQIQAGKLQV